MQLASFEMVTLVQWERTLSIQINQRHWQESEDKKITIYTYMLAKNQPIGKNSFNQMWMIKLAKNNLV